MHSHVSGSQRAKFYDDDFNSFRGIACEGHTRTHTQTRGRQSYFVLRTHLTFHMLFIALNNFF